MISAQSKEDKVAWSGRLVSVQPRIRLSRSFDERYHSYLGYVLHLNGTLDGQSGESLIAVGKGAHERYSFRIGMELSGVSVPVNDSRLETAGFYGHRRLDPRTYQSKCFTCIWGCHMPVEIILDQWNPAEKKYRFETFCYGPKSCRLYRAGATRKVPGRRGMTWEEEDWIDDEVTSHRGPDE